MFIRPSLILVIAAFVFTSCATRPKTYTAPSAAKMNASSQRLNQTIAKAHETAKRAQTQVATANEAAGRMAIHSGSVRSKLDALEKKVPTELKSEVAAIRDDAEAEHTDETVVVTSIHEATVSQTILERDIKDAEVARDQLKADQAQYVTDAGRLAQSATDERNYRIAAEKQLSLQRWYGWLWKIGIGFVILVVVGIIILKVTGQLGLLAAKVGLKL